MRLHIFRIALRQKLTLWTHSWLKMLLSKRVVDILMDRMLAIIFMAQVVAERSL